MAEDKQKLVFENVWRKDIQDIRKDIVAIWQQHGGPEDGHVEERLKQLVYIIRNEFNQVVGISTAFKVQIKQLRNYLYAFRCIIVPQYRIPGLASKFLVLTRDFLESIHESDGPEKAIGVITLVENTKINEHRTEAIWPASKMVYIGNSKNGSQIRVYYFKGARIFP